MDATNWISRAQTPAAALIENRARVVEVTVTSGTGGPCAYCHKQINPECPAYEVEAYVAAGLRTLQFHRVCLHLWETLTQPATMDADRYLEPERPGS